MFLWCDVAQTNPSQACVSAPQNPGLRTGWGGGGSGRSIAIALDSSYPGFAGVASLAANSRSYRRTNGHQIASAIPRFAICSKSAFGSPPLLRYAPTGAGSVQTTSMYGGRTSPNRIAHQDRITSTVGASTKGGASLPFITTGAPKRSGSLMLNIAGTIPAFPTSRSCLLLAKSSISAKARVVPDPPCQTNQMKNSWVNTWGGGCPALAAAMFSASAASQSGRTAARMEIPCTPTSQSPLSISTTISTAGSESPPCSRGRIIAAIPPARSIPRTCTTNQTSTTQLTLGSSAAKLRTTTSGAPPVSLMPQFLCWKKCSVSTTKIAAAKAGNRPAAPSPAMGSSLFTGYCAIISTASAVVAPATGSVCRRFESDKAVAAQA